MSARQEGIVLFAHGSRDPKWAAPFERIAASVARRRPDAAVGVAYLERMRPSLHEAIAALVSHGVTRIRIVPVFLGQGGHVKEDLPELAAAARNAHRGIDIVLEPAIGEQSAVVEAIASAIAGA